MKKVIGLLAGILCAAVGVTPISAQQTQVWGEVGPWTIGIDDELFEGCFAVSQYEGGTLLRFGLTGADELAAYHLIVGNESWASIEEGKDYDIILQLDRAEPWDTTAVGVNIGGVPSLIVASDNVTFFEEFRRKHGITIWFGDREVAALSLRGSSRAAVEMARCHLERYGNGGSSAPRPDPFTSDKPESNIDPFAI